VANQDDANLNILLGVIFIINLFLLPWSILHFGGNALFDGDIVAGHYFVNNHGVATELSAFSYYFSMVHGLIFILIVLITMARLIFLNRVSQKLA